MLTGNCGRSSLVVPAVGLGCWSFGSGAEDYWGAQDQADVERVVHRAIDVGCNFFDTAEAYNAGASELSLGKALKGRRDGAIIATKIAPGNTAPTVLREHCEASLRRLDTDYIDLYMVHWPIESNSILHFGGDEDVIKNPPSTRTAFETLMQLREEGKIRHIGVSNFGVRQLTEALATGSEIVANQLIYNLLSRAIEMEIMPFCREKGIGVIGYMPLLQGLLTGKYSCADEMPIMRTRVRQFSGDRPKSRHGETGAEKETFDAVREIRSIAEEINMPMAQLSMAWAASNPAVASIIPGARNIEQLEANALAGEELLNPAIIERLNDVTDALKEELGPNADYFQGAEESRIR